MATKRARVKRSRRSGNGNSGLSIAVIAGLVPGITWSLEPAQAGNWSHSMERAIAAYSGYYLPEKRFRLDLMAHGLFPLVFGMMIHSLANRYGINRFVKKLLPVPVGI